MAEGLRVNGQHPWLLSAQAMLAQEDADLDRAHDLAGAVLRDHPDYVAAAHVTTHVHYERGEHQGGLTWLGDWVDRDMRPSCEYAAHLSWHAGLHELALDDRDAVLRRLAAMVGPGAPPAWLLSNGASYLWRLKLAGVVAMDADPTDEPFRQRTHAVSASPPMVFAGWNAVLGLGCLGDVVALAALERGDVASRAPGVQEVLPGLAAAVRALLEDRPAQAADALLAQRHEWYRVGGSRAQREVLEDTLLAALVRAGRTELAAEVLTERLDRRPSAGDSARLAALAVPLRSSPARRA